MPSFLETGRTSTTPRANQIELYQLPQPPTGASPMTAHVEAYKVIRPHTETRIADNIEIGGPSFSDPWCTTADAHNFNFSKADELRQH
jgi:hypothetical protein